VRYFPRTFNWSGDADLSETVLAAAVGALATLLGALLSSRMHRRRDVQTRLHDQRRELYMELLRHLAAINEQQHRHRSTRDSEQLRFRADNSKSTLLVGQMMMLSGREVYDRACAVFDALETRSHAIEFHRDGIKDEFAVQRQLHRLIPAIRRELGVAEGRESSAWADWISWRFSGSVEDAPSADRENDQ
jgi:hypothetical protein